MGSRGKVAKVVRKSLKEMNFHFGGGLVNYFPGHMAVATRQIRTRIKIVDLVIEVRDARIPLTSAYQDLQETLAQKRRIIVLNKKDLVSRREIDKWVQYFESCNQHCVALNGHNRISVKKLLNVLEERLKNECAVHDTLLVMMIGIPNVGKSVIINALHQIARSRFRFSELGNVKLPRKPKKAQVGPFPGVTQDFAGFRIGRRPSTYVLDTPGVLHPRLHDVESGLKLAAIGSVKDSEVGEDRIARYILALLNIWKIPLGWKLLERPSVDLNQNETREDKRIPEVIDKKKKKSALTKVSRTDVLKDDSLDAKIALCTKFTEFDGDLQNADDLDWLIQEQFEALEVPLRIHTRVADVRMAVSKRFLKMYRAGFIGSYVLDHIPHRASKS